jgi:Ca2+-binding RTX toxin-like protein
VVCTEALEVRLLYALCKAAGGSGYSGTLSTNPATRQQQLICDPNEPAAGSTSVSYDASLVTINHAESGPGYTLTGVFVEVVPVVIEGPPAGPELVPLAEFQQSRPFMTETGYIQVKYQLTGEAGQLPPAGDVNDEAGVDGVDTHALFFDPIGGPILLLRDGDATFAPDVVAQQEGPVYTYTVFAAHAGEHGNNEEDFLLTTDGVRIGPDQLSPAVVTTEPVAGKPVASATAPAETAGGPVEVTLLATDASPADEAAGFTYLVDVGDGSPLLTGPATAGNGAGVNVQHTYTDVGVFTITLTATDQHGETSDPFTTQVSVGGVELRDDPSGGKQALYVIGSSGDDVIRFDKAGNGLNVIINGHTFGPFYDFDRVIAYGNGGNDDIRMNAVGIYSVLFFGGTGSDILVAGNGNAILSGGEGKDTTIGGNGSDLLIGGSGADNVQGGNGEDILVAGRTSYDNGSDDDVRALTNILDERTRGGRYELRIDRITGAAGGGANGTSRFVLAGVGQNVFDDAAADNLTGGSGRDWLLLHGGGANGDSSDLARNETGSTI